MLPNHRGGPASGGSREGRPGLPARQTGGGRRSSAMSARGGPEFLLTSLSLCGGGRSVPARHWAARPPGIEKKENCAPVCADPVDL